MNSISSRIIITSIVLVVCTAFSIGAIQYFDYTKDQRENRNKLLEYEIDSSAQYLLDIAKDARRDVMFLSTTPPVQGVVRARSNNGIDPLDGSTEERWKERLGKLFFALAQNNSDYLQIRYISIEDNGQEVVRVDQRDGVVKTIPENQLQNKGMRDYVMHTAATREGELSIFSIDLNREFGVIERPFLPVMRVATPVYTPDGNVFGIVIININMKQVLARMSKSNARNIEIYLTNENGDFLVHPDVSKAFGFELGTPHQLQVDFPETASFVNDSAQVNFTGLIESSDGRQMGVMQKIPFGENDDSRYLLAAALSPEKIFWADIRQTRNNVLLITLLFAISGGTLAFFFARMIVRPHTELSSAAQQLEEGVEIDQLSPPRSEATEVAQLSKSFFSMASTLKERQEVLEEKEANIRAILESAETPILTFDAKGKIIIANPATTQLFGYLPSEITGLDFADIVPEYRKSVGKSEDLRSMEYDARTKDGTVLPVHLSLGEIEFSERVQHTAILTDLREQKKLDKLRNELSEQKRMDGLKTEFISTVSHELRTPLTSIMGSLGLVASGAFGAIPEQAENLLTMARKNGDRLVYLINDILDIEKVQSGSYSFEFAYHGVNTLLKDAVAGADGFALQHKVGIDLKLLSTDMLVRVDAGRFEQIMSNLLSNAIKFSQSGDIVDVEAKLTDGRLNVFVRDNGSGIPLEFRPQIFDKFTQADSSSSRAKNGTGLGLSIAKAIVEKFGGTIGFDSEIGKGTCFFFEMPAYKMRDLDLADAPSLIIYSVEDVPPHLMPNGARAMVKSRASIEQLRDAVQDALAARSDSLLGAPKQESA